MSEPSTTRLFCPCGAEIFRKISASGRGGRPPTYCADCKRKRARKAVNDFNARARAGGGPATSLVCQDCNEEHPRPSRFGAIPKRCPSCFQEYERLRLLAWNADNPERRTAHLRKSLRKRRALLRAAEVEDFEVYDIYDRDKWRCQLCRKKVSKTLGWPHPMSPSLDHIIPLSQGGGHVRSNVQLAHLRCNLSKHTRPVGEQMLLIG